MEKQVVDAWIAANSKSLPAEMIVPIRDALYNADESKYLIATSTELKNPTVMLIISIFLGELGVDRFMFGEIGMGILKLLTGGLCYILWIIDIIGSSKKTRNKNFEAIMNALK